MSKDMVCNVAHGSRVRFRAVTRNVNAKGMQRHTKAARNCGKYPSDDQAQIAFLDRGGPERDRLGLDPDGDGYACGWDPAPFRNAVKN